ATLAPVGSGQYRSGGREGLAGHVLGRALPGGGIGRLVADVARVALTLKRGEELLERHAPLSRWQTVQRLAWLEAGARHVTVLHVGDLFGAYVVDVARRGAGAAKVIGVEQEAGARVCGAGHDLAHGSQRVELLALRVEFHGQAHAVLARDVADFPDAAGRFGHVAASAVHRAHDGRRAERLRAGRLFGEHVQQARPLLAGGPDP